MKISLTFLFFTSFPSSTLSTSLAQAVVHTVLCISLSHWNLISEESCLVCPSGASPCGLAAFLTLKQQFTLGEWFEVETVITLTVAASLCILHTAYCRGLEVLVGMSDLVREEVVDLPKWISKEVLWHYQLRRGRSWQQNANFKH